MASLQFRRLSLTFTGGGALRVSTEVMDPLGFWLISWRSSLQSDRSILLECPDSRHKPRNAGQVFATNRETRIFAAKYA